MANILRDIRKFVVNEKYLREYNVWQGYIIAFHLAYTYGNVLSRGFSNSYFIVGWMSHKSIHTLCFMSEGLIDKFKVTNHE